MIIVAGQLTVAAADRDAYLAAVADVAVQARASAGCLDFVQVADAIEPGRIVIYERWESDEDLQAFRHSGSPGQQSPVPDIVAADVHKYRIAAIEAP